MTELRTEHISVSPWELRPDDVVVVNNAIIRKDKTHVVGKVSYIQGNRKKDTTTVFFQEGHSLKYENSVMVCKGIIY